MAWSKPGWCPGSISGGPWVMVSRYFLWWPIFLVMPYQQKIECKLVNKKVVLFSVNLQFELTW